MYSGHVQQARCTISQIHKAILKIAAGAAALALCLTNALAADQVKILQTWQVSTNARGQPANGSSSDPAIAPHKMQGRVAFASTATNLTSAKTDGFSNIYVKNVGTGAVSLVTRGFNGEPANGDSFAPVYSPDGKKIAFVSRASNLVPGDTNGRLDVFMIDRRVGEIRRISTRSDRGQLDGNSSGVRFSPNGQSIIFTTDASNILPGKIDRLTKVIWKSMKGGRVACVSCTPSGQVGEGLDADFTSDGQRVIFMSRSGFLGDTRTSPTTGMHSSPTS